MREGALTHEIDDSSWLYRTEHGADIHLAARGKLMFAHHCSHALKILVRTDHELHHVAFVEQLEILAKHLIVHA